MKSGLILLLLLMMITACTVRMGSFAPRRPDTTAHREATRETCLECHDLSKMSDHKTTEDCLRCHKRVKGI
ncbi:MAG: hypothetical protein GW875_03645 [Deltaproteobacteria bacterium]|nr:hypothetical protein [Deltaproteobacteria bacterium]